MDRSSKRAKLDSVTNHDDSKITPFEVNGLMISIFAFLPDLDHSNLRSVNKLCNAAGGAPRSWPPHRYFCPTEHSKVPLRLFSRLVEQMVLNSLTLVGRWCGTGSREYVCKEADIFVHAGSMDLCKMLARSKDTLTTLAVVDHLDLEEDHILTMPHWAPNLTSLTLRDSAINLESFAKIFYLDDDIADAPSAAFASLTSLTVTGYCIEYHLIATLRSLPQLQEVNLHPNFHRVSFKDAQSICGLLSRMKLRSLSMDCSIYHRCLFSHGGDLLNHLEFLSIPDLKASKVLPDVVSYPEVESTDDAAYVKRASILDCKKLIGCTIDLGASFGELSAYDFRKITSLREMHLTRPTTHQLCWLAKIPSIAINIDNIQSTARLCKKDCKGAGID